MTVREAYEHACNTPSDIWEHLPRFYSLALELDAKNVIELGTRTGVSTAAWLYAMETTGGHVWSVDVDPAPAMRHDRWTFVRGDDLDPEVVKALPDNADVVFIDTSHAYQQTLAELNVYLLKVRPGGRIVLHDTELRRPEKVGPQPPFPVKRAVTEFCYEEGLPVEFLPNCFGLALISVPEG